MARSLGLWGAGDLGCALLDTRRPAEAGEFGYLTVVASSVSNVHRQDLYKQGGLLSVTSRILIVDMLQGDIPVHLITGMLILHAERCVPTCFSLSIHY